MSTILFRNKFHTGAIDLSIVKSIPNHIKAIVPVLYAGSASGYTEILDYCKNHDIRVVADAAHAFGTVVNDKLVGELGDITCFSFDGIKNITCGEGGCIVTADALLSNYLKIKDYWQSENTETIVALAPAATKDFQVGDII